VPVEEAPLQAMRERLELSCQFNCRRSRRGPEGRGGFTVETNWILVFVLWLQALLMNAASHTTDTQGNSVKKCCVCMQRRQAQATARAPPPQSPVSDVHFYLMSRVKASTIEF
jgi:hypothetical protein